MTQNTRILSRAAAAILTCLATTAAATTALAAGGGGEVVDYDWSFEGPTGRFDDAQLQRGWQVYSELCSSCHSLQYLKFRNLTQPGGPEFSEELVEAFIAEGNFEVMRRIDGVDERFPATLNDPILGGYLSREEAAANGPAIPDLTLMVKARSGYSGILNTLLNGGGGPEYVYSVLTGYPEEAPDDWDVSPGLHFNWAFSGHEIAMARPIYDGGVTYRRWEEHEDGSLHPGEEYQPTTKEIAADVAAFLMWAAEPNMEDRKRAGVRGLILLGVFLLLLWQSNQKLWAPIKAGRSA